MGHINTKALKSCRSTAPSSWLITIANFKLRKVNYFLCWRPLSPGDSVFVQRRWRQRHATRSSVVCTNSFELCTRLTAKCCHGNSEGSNPTSSSPPPPIFTPLSLLSIQSSLPVKPSNYQSTTPSGFISLAHLSLSLSLLLCQYLQSFS